MPGNRGQNGSTDGKTSLDAKRARYDAELETARAASPEAKPKTGAPTERPQKPR